MNLLDACARFEKMATEDRLKVQSTALLNEIIRVCEDQKALLEIYRTNELPHTVKEVRALVDKLEREWVYRRELRDESI